MTRLAPDQSGMMTRTPLLELPDEMLAEIAASLPVADLARFGATCRQVRRVTTQDALWRAHLNTDWTETSAPATSAFAEYGQRTALYNSWKAGVDLAVLNPLHCFLLVGCALWAPIRIAPPPSLRCQELGFVEDVQKRCIVLARLAVWHLLFVPFLVTVLARPPLESLAVAGAWLAGVLYLCFAPRSLRRVLPWWVLRCVAFAAIAWASSSCRIASLSHLALCPPLAALALHLRRTLDRQWPLRAPHGAANWAGRRVLRCVRAALRRHAAPGDVLAAMCAVACGMGGAALIPELLYCAEVILLLAALLLGRWADALRSVVDLATGHLPTRVPVRVVPTLLLYMLCAVPAGWAALVHLQRRREGRGLDLFGVGVGLWVVAWFLVLLVSGAQAAYAAAATLYAVQQTGAGVFLLSGSFGF